MEVTIDVPDEIVARAAELKMPVETLLLKALHDLTGSSIPPGFTSLGASNKTPQQAGESIRAIRDRSTLGGLKIKDLIEEGRRL